MRILQASYIIPLNSAPIPNGYLYIEDDGTVIHVSKETPITDQFEVEVYEGLICPGFVNTHCHLELSHMKEQMPEGTGLAKFVDEVPKRRQQEAKKSILIEKADEEMCQAGIVAVGDISNTSESIETKKKSPIQYHSFVELYGLERDAATHKMEEGIVLLGEFEKNNLAASIVPHAPYSVSPDLLQKIYSHKEGSLLSIHHQETSSENELFIEGQGELAETFLKKGFDLSAHLHFGKSSTEFSLTPYLSPSQKVLLVHNTYSSAQDIDRVASHFSDAYWCTCPKANWYIERRLPNYHLWLEKNLNITVGTDSLASNDTLSVLEELKLIQSKFPAISTSELLSWACKNGAEFFEFQSLGTFESGKKPGVLLIEHVEGMTLTKNSKIKVLVN